MDARFGWQTAYGIDGIDVNEINASSPRPHRN
jgi:hypothetical protein